MIKEKEILLNETYQRFMDYGLGACELDGLDSIVAENVMGFGTTIDEKMFTLSELRELLIRQRAQTKGINIDWELKPLWQYASDNEDTAVFAGDIFLAISAGAEKVEMYIRFSVVLEYKNDQWVVIHWHGSKPENVQSEEDTFGIEDWKQKTATLEKLVAERTADLIQKNTQLETAMANLKMTQDQLIQSEKMASLGELTAGIAHEIQNPLNFVNNFSEVSTELISEMKQELAQGNYGDVNGIADDIRQNLEKITHHGKRADGIVKGMLQHSRASSNSKEPGDINKLTDEYLRLAYHGLRAKDKSFNADLVTDFSTALPEIPMISQDLGRVLLNLFTNAFYAVRQKQNMAGSDYKPELNVSTSLKGKLVEIIVKDNGVGIPDAIKDKVLQPFFTTKPAGEGTGLGLSLSYDTIVKGHGGSITIESKVGQGSIFIITLPVKAS